MGDSDRDSRLYKTLDNISDRLTGIEQQFSRIPVLEQRVSVTEKRLDDRGVRLDKFDVTFQEARMWQVKYEASFSTLQKSINKTNHDVSAVRRNLNFIIEKNLKEKGRNEVKMSIMKWTLGIITSVFVYVITKGIY